MSRYSLLFTPLLALGFGLLLFGTPVENSARAQPADQDHSAHHPPGAAPDTADPNSQSTPDQQAPAIPSPPAASMGGMSGMGGMMEMMMGKPPRQFFPSLMNLPELSAEDRVTIEEQARVRVEQGLRSIADGQAAANLALAESRLGEAESALSTVRSGIDQVRSGAAALRALMEGQSASAVGLTWYRSQLSLPIAAGDRNATNGDFLPFGLSVAHVISMAFAAALLLGFLTLHFARRRRVEELLGRLTSTSAIAPVGANGPAEAAVKATSGATSGKAENAIGTTKPWSGKLRVARIFQETPTVRTFRLAAGDRQPLPFTFSPGQFLTFAAEIGDKPERRSYTIASSPTEMMYVDVTVKREESGIFSRYLHDTIQEGDELKVIAPSGAFVFRGQEANSIVLIGGGVGITPLMSIVRYLLDISWKGEIHLLYGVKTISDFIFREELEYLQKRHPNLTVVAIVEQPQSSTWMGNRGRISRDFIAQNVPDIVHRRVHLCGPLGMMEATKKCLLELGVPADQIKTEAFGPTKGAFPPPPTGSSPVRPTSGNTAADQSAEAPVSEHAAAATIGPATARVRFSISDKTVAMPPDKTVLEVAEANEVPIDYSCRTGICGLCKVHLQEGSVTMEIDEALTPEDKARGIILACQAKSLGNLVVEA